MMLRPVLFDLCSGAGGAGHGCHLAGFRVIGVDPRPMPRHRHEFIRADAMQVLEERPRTAQTGPAASEP